MKRLYGVISAFALVTIMAGTASAQNVAKKRAVARDRIELRKDTRDVARDDAKIKRIQRDLATAKASGNRAAVKRDMAALRAAKNAARADKRDVARDKARVKRTGKHVI